MIHVSVDKRRIAWRVSVSDDIQTKVLQPYGVSTAVVVDFSKVTHEVPNTWLCRSVIVTTLPKTTDADLGLYPEKVEFKSIY